MAVRGAAWRVSGEHVQPGQSAAPDGPHTLGHTLLPEGAHDARAQTGGQYTQHVSANSFCVHSCVLALVLLCHCDFTFPSLVSRTLMNGPVSQFKQPANSFSSFPSIARSLSLCSSLQGMPDDQVDLQREIAFNLSLIYQASGNMGMARQLINTHCVV